VCIEVLARMVSRSSSSDIRSKEVLVMLVSLVLAEGSPAFNRDLLTNQVCQFQVDKDGGYHQVMCRRAEICGQLALVPPSPGSASLETWLVKKEERVKLCQRLEYAERGRDQVSSAVLFPPSPLHNQPSSVLPLFPFPSTIIPQHHDEKEEEFIFPDSPIQPLGMDDYDLDELLQPLDFYDYAEEELAEELEEDEGEREGVENKAAKVDYDQSAEINLSIEDVKNNLKENLSIEDVSNELEENFEFGSLEDEELEDSADESMKTGEDMVDLEEIFTAADSVEKADNDSIENITDGTNTKESKDGSGEEAVEGEDGSANDVGGTAIFDSIDLVRQAVEFLTVSK